MTTKGKKRKKTNRKEHEDTGKRMKGNRTREKKGRKKRDINRKLWPGKLYIKKKRKSTPLHSEHDTNGLVG